MPPKVMTIVGTRPEIIRLSSLIAGLDKIGPHILVHTGQNYDKNLNDVFFEDLGLRDPDYRLHVDTSSLGSVMGDVIRKIEAVLLAERPDAVMILGDTNSAISAVVAERLQIPVYHMEAGNRSFDANVPEELNRKLVDHVSTFNLAYNSHSQRNLVREGIHPRFIFVTGSPLPEVLANNYEKIEQSKIHQTLNLESRKYFLASIHRQENVDSPERLSQVFDSLNFIAEKWELPTIVSTHPRTRKRLETAGTTYRNLTLIEPLGFLDYNKLQLDAFCVLSDSGTISEESSILGFPAVTLRDSIERPEAFDAGSLVLAGLKKDTLEAAVRAATSFGAKHETPEGYASLNFSKKVINIMLSTYSQYKNWKNLDTSRKISY